MPIYAEIYTEHIFGSPSTFFVNCVCLVFLFVLQLGLLCLVQRSKPCQHITLFIRQRCYQISLRLEETLLSNNYRIYIYVLPVRETLKCECQSRAGVVSSVLNGNRVGQGGIREWILHWYPAAGGCEESSGGRYNCLNWNFSKAEEVVKSTGLIMWPLWFYFSPKRGVGFFNFKLLHSSLCKANCGSSVQGAAVVLAEGRAGHGLGWIQGCTHQ